MRCSPELESGPSSARYSFQALLTGLCVATAVRNAMSKLGSRFYALLTGLCVATDSRIFLLGADSVSFYALLTGLCVATKRDPSIREMYRFLCPVDRAMRCNWRHKRRRLRNQDVSMPC